MRKLFDFGNRFARQSTWKDFALTKLCLFSMGLALGTLVGETHKKGMMTAAICVFAATYILLIVRMLRVARRREK